MSEIKIKKNKEKIVKLLNENVDLEYNLRIKKFTRVSEQIKNIGTKKKPKIVNLKLGHWFEWFYDEDYPNDKKQAAKIERSQAYEVEGKKSDHWILIEYYTIDDI